jgi:hypothetical protein
MGHNDTPFGQPTPGQPIGDEEWIVIRRPLRSPNNVPFWSPTPGWPIGDEEWIVIKRMSRDRNDTCFGWPTPAGLSAILRANLMLFSYKS